MELFFILVTVDLVLILTENDKLLNFSCLRTDWVNPKYAVISNQLTKTLKCWVLPDIIGDIIRMAIDWDTPYAKEIYRIYERMNILIHLHTVKGVEAYETNFICNFHLIEK